MGNPALSLRTVRSRFAAFPAARRYGKSQKRYGDCLRRLHALDIPSHRAARLELMASCLENMADLELLEEDTRARYETAKLLRQVAATERGCILVPADQWPGGHCHLWLRLAASWDHADRAAILAGIREELAVSALASRVLFSVMLTEEDAAKRAAS